jgi:hypothetical protein
MRENLVTSRLNDRRVGITHLGTFSNALVRYVDFMANFLAPTETRHLFWYE